MSMTMFAAYDTDGILEPQYFPLELPTESPLAIWRRMKKAHGVGKVLGEYPKSIIAVDGDTALIHFGHIIRFLGDDPTGDPTTMLAAYTSESSQQDEATLIAIAEQVVINPDFMSHLWEYRRPIRREPDGKVFPPQEHLHIALVTDMFDLSLSASAALDLEVSA